MVDSLGPLHTQLLDHAARGEPWEPKGRPEIPAAWIRDLVVDGDADGRTVCPKGVRVRAVTVTGVLDFEFATLKVPLLLREVDISEPINLEQAEGIWISITGSRLGGVSALQLRLKHSLVLSRSTINGPTILTGAQIGGDLDCSGATFLNPGGPAIGADRIQVTGSVFLIDSHAEGEIRLLGGVVGGSFECSGASLHNPGGYALLLDGTQIAGDVFLNRKFQTEGSVRLSGATIDGGLECVEGTFHAPSGFALFGQGLTVKGGLLWMRVSHVDGAVVLMSAHVGDLADDPQSWQFADATYNLQGLRIDRFAGTGDRWTWQQRVAWLDASDGSGPGPYEMVVRWYRSVGRNHAARKIAIAKQQSLSATTPWWRKPAHWLWGVSAGYGYQPWRLALWLLLFYLLGVLVFSESRMLLASVPEVYPFNPFIYSADVLLPIVDLKQVEQWVPAGQLATVTTYVLLTPVALLVTLGAALASLFVKD